MTDTPIDIETLLSSTDWQDRIHAASILVSASDPSLDDQLVRLLRDQNDIVVQRTTQQLLRERREGGVSLVLNALGAPPESYDDLDEPGQFMLTALSLAQGLDGIDVSSSVLHALQGQHSRQEKVGSLILIAWWTKSYELPRQDEMRPIVAALTTSDDEEIRDNARAAWDSLTRNPPG
jgi:hypothetical protein